MEVNTYYGRCVCCFTNGYLKNMWTEYFWEGKKEIYVEMLVQCFGLSWDSSENAIKRDRICEICITKLRDANEFKNTVLYSQTRLDYIDKDNSKADFDNGNDEDIDDTKVEYEEIEFLDDEDNKDFLESLPVKIEKVNLEESIEDADNENIVDNSLYIDEPYDSLCDDRDDPDYPDVDNNSQEMSFEEVEYLEDEDVMNSDNKPTQVQRRMKGTVPPSNRKWPKKLPKAERYKTYKQYSEEDLRACMEELKNEKITLRKASEKYNIPRKTLAAKIRYDSKERDKKAKETKDANREKKFKFIQEIKMILTYTNATPYKSKANRYNCIYCTTQNHFYDNAEELRTHTRTEHSSERIQKIEYVLRPYWSNEIIKLDIHDLQCIVCNENINDWNDMFTHLKNKHDVVLDQAYTKVIPYDLTEQLYCALCKQGFVFYMHLDVHMNAHYNNYVCFDCGDTFLAEARLKQHVKKHDIGVFPCSFCDKIFAVYKYKVKHEELFHRQRRKFKCQYCDEKFGSEYIRHTHMVEKHKEKVIDITCEICGKTFTWRPYYMKHMKFKHDSNSRKFKCEECGKRYFQLFELKEHMLRHTGKKHFTCYICNKKYVSSGSLKHHINRHIRLGDCPKRAAGDNNDSAGENMKYTLLVKVEGSDDTQNDTHQ